MRREQQKRIYELMLLNDLGLSMSQYLLEGEDIRGLNLRDVKGLNQAQIDRVLGDHTTQLPGYVTVPKSWS